MPDSDEVRLANVDAICAIDCSAAGARVAALALVQDRVVLLVPKVDLAPATQALRASAASLELPVCAVVAPNDRNPVAMQLLPLLTAKRHLVPSDPLLVPLLLAADPEKSSKVLLSEQGNLELPVVAEELQSAAIGSTGRTSKLLA